MAAHYLLMLLALQADAPAGPPRAQLLTPEQLANGVFADPRTQSLTETSEAAAVPARDLVWSTSSDGCLQTGVYETGRNRYTISDPYPHDEIMFFISGSVTLTSDDGERLEAGAGSAVSVPKGWTGVWDSPGYRKVYLIYDCPAD